MWLQSWPMLYAILNSAMTFYAKQNGAPVVLSELSQIQLNTPIWLPLPGIFP